MNLHKLNAIIATAHNLFVANDATRPRVASALTPARVARISRGDQYFLCAWARDNAASELYSRADFAGAADIIINR